ncbi:hypothetical protein BHE74_00012206 [Ensete ventricosum]|nr:hypothetical protein GW17_00002135 [Ensete ventricosum]RWW79496.1 hypothetical protein BHE74_00012206 [Ensete ventricosum]RZR82733.1 hypothetical protein BHM03_00009222 [Ensete ventricosum]
MSAFGVQVPHPKPATWKVKRRARREGRGCYTLEAILYLVVPTHLGLSKDDQNIRRIRWRMGSIIGSIDIMPWDVIKSETSGNENFILIKQKRWKGQNCSSSSLTDDRGAASGLVKLEVKIQDPQCTWIPCFIYQISRS